MSFGKAIKSFVKELRAPEPSGSKPAEQRAIGISALVAGMQSGWEPTAAGEVVNAHTAMCIIPVNACIRVIANGISSLPCKLYQKDSNGGRTQQFTTLATILAEEPNEEMTGVSFWSSMAMALALVGNCYAEIQRNGAQDVIGIWPLSPLLTRPMRDQLGNIYYETTDSQDNVARRIEAANMFHVPINSYDGVLGISPIHCARQSLGLTRAAELMAARLFGNGSKPGGLLSTTQELSPEAMEASKRSWMETQSGSKQGSTAVLTGDWKYTPLSINPTDAQFLETREFQRAECASLFGVPASMIGDTNGRSKATSEQEALTFLQDTLRPYLCKIEAEIKRKLIGTNKSLFAEFDVRERLRTDLKTQMDSLGTAMQWGFYTTNMALEDLGKNPIGPAGDVFWAPLNMQNAANLSKTAEPDVANPADQDAAAQLLATNEDRKMLRNMTTTIIPIFRDAYTRLTKRDKRTAETVQEILSPSLRAIADISLADVRTKHGLHGTNALDTSAVIVSTCKSLAKRMENVDTSNLEAHISAEFSKTIRSIYINIAKEVAGAIADQDLKKTTAKADTEELANAA